MTFIKDNLVCMNIMNIENEITRCKEDPIYFINRYCKLYDTSSFFLEKYQEKIINKFQENNLNIFKMPRQSRKTYTGLFCVLHYMIFNQDKRAAIFGYSYAESSSLLIAIQKMYEHLPKWMKPGLVTFTKDRLELENGCKLITRQISNGVLCGRTLDLIFIDEFAYFENRVGDYFMQSLFPMIDKDTKVLIMSTPNLKNHFYQMWIEAKTGYNGFVATEIYWWENPVMKNETVIELIQRIGMDAWRREYECSFSI